MNIGGLIHSISIKMYSVAISVSDIAEQLDERTKSNGKIDQIMLWESTSIIGRIASMVLGFLTMILLILVPIVTALEVAYIAFPPLREALDQYKVYMEDSKGVKNTALGFVLRDAVEAVKQANTEQIGKKSAMWIYLELKIKSVLMIGYILAVVLQGSGVIIDFVGRVINETLGVLERALSFMF